MPRIRVNDTDRVEAAKAVQALKTNNHQNFRTTVDEAFQRYGGVERLIYALSEELANHNETETKE